MRLRNSKRLALGVVGALLGGLAVGLLQDGGRSAASPTPESGPVTIPVGAIGDEVTYEAWRGRMGELSPVPSWSFRISRIDRTPDRAGAEQRVVVVDWDPGPVCRDEGADLEGNRWCYRLARSYLNLDSRLPVRFDEQYVDPNSTLAGGAVERSWTEGYSHFGPEFPFYGIEGSLWAGERLPPFHELTIPGATHQGRSYTVGEDLTNQTRNAFRLEWGLAEEEIVALEYQSWVEAEGTVGEDEALSIRTVGDLRFRAADSRSSERMVLHQNLPSGARLRFDLRHWVGPASPYPRLYEERTQIDEGPTQEWRASLLSYRPGEEGAIPWTPGQVAKNFDPVNVRAEHSPPAAHAPTDGERGRLPYRLADARRSVEQDPGLAGFAAWRQLNPSFALVGLSLTNDSYWDGSPRRGDFRTWELVFGAPPDRVMLVSSSRSANTGAILNREYATPLLTSDGQIPWPDLSQTFVALSAVEEIWKLIAPPGRAGLPPAGVSWGVRWLCTGTGLQAQYDATHECGNVPLAYLDDRSIQEIGFGEHVRMQQPPPGESGSRFWAVADSVTGNLLGTWFTHDWYPEVKPFGIRLPEGDRPPVAQPANADGLSGTARLGPPAAVASAGFFALFLAVYFYPLLKFFGSQAIVALPGYAKVRKEAVLNHKTRDDLLSAIRADPGISPPELQARVGAGWTTLVYHLRVLQRNGFVSSLIDGRHKRFFPADTVDWSQRGRLAVLRNEKSKTLYELIEAEPGLHQHELALRMRFSAPGAKWHLGRLEKAGLVAREADGRKLRYFASDPRGAGRPYDACGAVEVA